MSYVVASQIKELVKKLNKMSSSDFPEAVSKKVEDWVKAAAGRAEANGRTTLRPYDL
jgi:hypothetical protein